MAVTHQTAKTEFASGEDDIKYAYRRIGRTNGVPLLFLMHFRGTMDHWDPLLINSVAAHREVILFDNAGVGKSTGNVAASIKDMANHVIKFLSLIKVNQVDVLGFSLGGMVAPLVALNGPSGLVRRLIVAGSNVSAGEGVEVFPDERGAEIAALATPAQPGLEDFKKLFFYPSPASQEAAVKYWARVNERQPSTSGEQRSQVLSYNYADGAVGLQAQVAALGAFGDLAQRADGTYDRLGEVKIPVLVAQGKGDFMLPTPNSYLMQQRLPYAYLKIFPDSGHGFLFQFAEEFAEDVTRFLDH